MRNVIRYAFWKFACFNALLQREGFHGVMRLDDVRRLERLPVLGTGKTDYKQLRAMISETTPAAV